VFHKRKPKSFFQVLFWGTYWLRPRAQLQRLEERRQELENACRLLEISRLQLFSSSGWSSSLRILSACFIFSKKMIFSVFVRLIGATTCGRVVYGACAMTRTRVL